MTRPWISYLFLALAVLMLADCVLGMYLDRRLFRYVGAAWDTTDKTSKDVVFFTEELPELRTPVSGTYRLGYVDPTTNAVTYPLMFTSSGAMEFRPTRPPWNTVVWIRRGGWWQLRTPDDTWLLWLAPSFARGRP